MRTRVAYVPGAGVAIGTGVPEDEHPHDAEIARLRIEEGLGARTIAQRIGRTHHYVRTRFAALDLPPAEGGSKAGRTERVSVHYSPAEVAELRAWAERRGQTVSAATRDVVLQAAREEG